MSPDRKNVRASLAYCYLHAEDFAKAKTFADEALICDPSNTLAFEVLGAIQQIRPDNKANTAYVLVAGIILLFVIGGIGFGIFFVTTSDGYSTGEAMQNGVMEPLLESVLPVVQVEQSKTTPKGGTFPIELELPPGLELDVHVSKYNVYKDSSYYKFIGKIKNSTGREISEMKGTFTYNLQDGNNVHDVKTIHAKHRPISRPGDFSLFQETYKISRTTLKSVTLKVEIITSSQAIKPYPKSKEIPFKWASDISSNQHKISIFERSQSLGKASSFGQFHKVTWEFKNLGTTIKKLKMEIRYFSEKNEELEKKSHYLTSASSAPLESNETRTSNTIQKLPAGRFPHYEISVVEIE